MQIINSTTNEQQFIIRGKVLFEYIGTDTVVSIPPSVEIISVSAFKNCSNISSIYIPDTVTHIEDYAFVNCCSLKSIAMGFGIRNIPKGCFSGLRELETVILTDNVESFGDFAFENCISLKSLNFISKKYRDPVTPEEKGKAYEAMLLGKKAQIEYIDYADTVPTIKNVGRYSFAGCSNFNYEAIESAAKTVGVNAFDKKIKRETTAGTGVKPSISCASPETNVEIFTEIKATTNNAEHVQQQEPANVPAYANMAQDPVQDGNQHYLLEGYAVVGDHILNCATGQTAPDCKISGLDMDFTSTLILRRAGKLYEDTITLAQILQIQPEQLASVKHATPAQIKKAVNQLTELLDSIFKPRPDKQQETILCLTMFSESETAAVEANGQHNEKHVQGAMIEEDELVSGLVLEDVAICEGLVENAEQENFLSEHLCTDMVDEEPNDELAEKTNSQSENVENKGRIPTYILEEITVKENGRENIDQEVCLPELNNTHIPTEELDSTESVELIDHQYTEVEDTDSENSIDESAFLKEMAIESKMDAPKTIIRKTRQFLIEGYAVVDEEILCCSTGARIPDRKISKSDLESMDIMILRKVGNLWEDDITLSQVLRIYPSHVLNFSKATPEQTQNLIQHLTNFLKALFAPQPISARNTISTLSIEPESCLSPEVEKVDQEDSNCFSAEDEITEETEREPLINGYEVVDGVIYRTDTNQRIEDAPVTVLNLSNRAYNCLRRTKAYTTKKIENVMISSVLKLTPAELRSIRNMGAKTVDEIIESIELFLESQIGNGVILPQQPNTIAPDYEVIEGFITNIISGKVVSDELVDCLNLGARATNSLRRGKVKKLSELVVLTQRQLQSLPNMGPKSVMEISEILPIYLKNHEVDKKEKLVVMAQPSSVMLLPPMDAEVPVLAEEFSVVNGEIISRKNLTQIPDASIDVLGLSVRATNCLERSGRKRISQLIGLPYDEFRKIRNLGVLSANEVQEKLEMYLSRYHSAADSNISQEKVYSAIDVLDILKEHEYESLSLNEICDTLPKANEENIIQLVEYLLHNGSIEKNGNAYSVYHHSFAESISTRSEAVGLDDRAATVLQMRSSGATLEEAGKQIGVTRERVRQIEKNAMDKLTRRGRVHFAEDKYAYFFTTYATEKELFFDYLKETEQVWYYLTTRYRKGKEELSKAIDDPKVTVELRRAADRYIHRGYIQVDGVYIPALRGDIEDYVVEKYCKDEVSLDEFYLLYDNFLQENDLSDERFQITDSTRATRSNRLTDSNKLLWKQNQRLRYYDVQSGDYSELLEVLNLGQYSDVELSTRKFLIDYPELMSRYDLRDEYEIHNLLKKIHAEKENPDMVFSRMPNIIFGTFDRDAAVKEMLFALAPISQDDFAEAISKEYGTRVDTIKANWLIGISDYYHQGMYSVDYEDMPEESVQILKTVLTEDFYYFAELRKIYSRAIPGADMSLLSTYNLKKMGFLIGSSYVLQNYPTAEAYFDHLLTEKDVVDIEPISKRYTSLTTYSVHLAELKHEVEIIEFEPYQYINIRRLRKLGYDKNRLRAYVDRVWSFLVNDEYFTIQSLKNAGFEDELDVLGFDDLFYSSLLREDSRFSWQRVGKAVVLNPKRTQFTVHDFLVDRVTKEKSIDVDDFVAMLQDEYGIIFERQDILTHVKGSDVYYDAIMGKLYADYATYFEEV